MKNRLLLALSAFAVAVSLRAQAPSPVIYWPDAIVRWDGGLPVSLYGTIQNNGVAVAQEPILNLIPGTNITYTIVDNPGSTRTDVTITSAAGGSVPSGTGFRHVVAGVEDAASKTVDLSSADATGVLAAARFPALTGDVTTSVGALATTIATSAVTLPKIANQAALTILANATNGSAAITAVDNSPVGTSIKSDGATLAARVYPVDPPTESILWNDFYCQPLAALITSCGDTTIIGTGTSAGIIGNVLATPDSNHPGVVTLTTGTTTTGTSGIFGSAPKNTSADAIVLAGGEAIEWMVYIPVASTGTDTHRTYIGMCDISSSSGDCADGIGVYWDNNADTHWGCETASASTRTTTLSTTVATAAAWHKVRLDVNAGATSVAYKVDGSTLSCSPLTTNIPTGITRGTSVAFRISASAGCAATTTCTAVADYVYFRKAVTR